MAAAAAECALKLRLEGVELIVRHEGEHGACEASAMYPHGAAAVQQLFAEGYGKSHFLMLAAA